MPTRPTPPVQPLVRLYDDDADHLVSADAAPEKIIMLPSGEGRVQRPQDLQERIRVMWGQDLLRDLLDGRYRAVVCGVNEIDNSHGVISQVCDLVSTSQWTHKSVTSYAKVFQDSAGQLAGGDKEPYVLKFDLDKLLVMAILRPRGRDHFTLADLARGFKTVTKMMRDRHDRMPIASVSFLNAKANKLIGADHQEPSFETVLKTMFDAGFRGDVYTSAAMWRVGNVGVFPSYPFPESVERMRAGSS
jgi:hypothetical protein